MEILKKLRKQKGVTQKEIADYLGISRVAYTNYENGRRNPDYTILIKIAIYFGVSVDFLLGKQKTQATNMPDKNCLYILGRDGTQQKISIPPDKIDRLRKLLEAGMPDLFDQDDDL